MKLQICKACLVSDVKMYGLNSNYTDIPIGEVYFQLMQIPILNSEEYVCYLCARLLQKFQEFKSKCQRAHDILLRLKLNNVECTTQTIKHIDRKLNKLTYNFTFTSLTDCYNVENEKSFDNDNNIDENDVKTEVEYNYNTDSNIKDEEQLLTGNDTHLHTEFIVNDHDQSIDVDNCLTSEECTLDNDDIPNKKKRKSSLKESNTKRRKSRNDTNSVKKKQDEDKSLSDDEPLSNKVANKVEKANRSSKRNYNKNFNASFFEDYATVVFLTPEEAKTEVLLRKESSNYKNSEFKCELCFRGYEANTAFANHMKKHSVDYGEHKCELCHLRFPQQEFLCKHRLACHKRKFYCKICPYVCFCTHQAKTHVSLHKGKKYPCKDCSEIFSMPNSLAMHRRLKHMTECVCELCGSTFATTRGLYFHNMKIHRQDTNSKQGPKCDECGIHFATDVAWKRHFVLSSKHIVCNGCKHCGERFTTPNELKTHMKSFHARKHFNRKMKLPPTCSICNKPLTRGEYKHHVTSEHPTSEMAKKFLAEDQKLKKFVCEVCGQMFKQQCFLTYHQRKHTGERPYACAECGKTFQTGGALAAHGAVHPARGQPGAPPGAPGAPAASRRAHKCNLCARLFTFKGALNKHMKGHLGIRPHKCAICDKSFINKCDVKLHIKYVHNKVPWPKRDRSKRNTKEETVSLVQYN